MVPRLQEMVPSQQRFKKQHIKNNMEVNKSLVVTHSTGEGKSVPALVKHCDSLSVATAVYGYKVSDDPDELNITDGCCDETICVRKTLKYFFFGLLVVFGQIALSVSLKHYGYIEKDLNEIVSERVVPQLQSKFEQTGLRMPQLNESIYWLRNINQTLPSMATSTPESSRPGYQLAKQGATATYPIIMIPGFVTSGLEVWQGKECAKHLFRQRVWGSVGMVHHWLIERQCVMEHMKLDLKTGKDPEDIRIRAATGFEAADYFAGNYWVWSKLIENLADIGYDGSMMSMESYDWRLSFPKLEERDGYLTKLKYRIEAFHKVSGKKVVIASHSLGGVLVHFFFKWVTSSPRDGGGGGGRDWVEKHIHSYINIAGPHLGVPKAATALLSGEMSDTVVLGTAGSLIEQFMGRKVRKALWTTWGSLWSMLPKGGDKIWNIGADFGTSPNEHGMLKMTYDPDMIDDESSSAPKCSRDDLVDPAMEKTVNAALSEFSSRGSHSVDQIVDFLSTWGGGFGPAISNVQMNSFDTGTSPSIATWHDISRTPLPQAKTMKIYCLYGVGLDTERAYFYRRNLNEGLHSSESNGEESPAADPPFILDTSIVDPDNNIVHGVRYADGDGSVPLLSLGYMCADGWRRRESGLNPGGSTVVTREYQHKQEMLLGDPMRGGPNAADHVDIMGNVEMMRDFLKVVSDFEAETIEDEVVSDIRGIARRINEHAKRDLSRKRNMFRRVANSLKKQLEKI